jgi:hypothetical protein
MRINTSKVRLVKCSFGGLRTPVERAIFFLVSSKDVFFYFFNQNLLLFEKITFKILNGTIDFNKHDINIFINLVKIVHYGRHCRDESCQ